MKLRKSRIRPGTLFPLYPLSAACVLATTCWTAYNNQTCATTGTQCSDNSGHNNCTVSANATCDESRTTTASGGLSCHNDGCQAACIWDDANGNSQTGTLTVGNSDCYTTSGKCPPE